MVLVLLLAWLWESDFGVKKGTVYCLLSDGECEEGSIWEAALFIRHHAIANLVVLIDANGLQGFGSTREVARHA